jgi:hypothetical protein
MRFWRLKHYNNKAAINMLQINKIRIDRIFCLDFFFTLWYLFHRAALLNFPGIFTIFGLKLAKMSAAEKSAVLIDYCFLKRQIKQQNSVMFMSHFYHTFI